jgi:ubiquinone/menaquinone biosynthesis C-methylase UbiE
MNDDKVKCMIKARKFEKEFWDGSRRFGYGGYKYIPGRWKKVAKQLIENYNLKAGSKVLDVGCGKGGGVSFYKDFYNFDNCIGIDLTNININIAKKHSKSINFYVASATNLPINNNTVDIVTCVESVLYYDPILKFVKEIFRVLKNNGKILISMPINKQQEDNLKNTFLNNGFILDKEEDITKNVRMACAISKFRFMDISFQESKMMYVDEQRYYDENIKYKNFIFTKKENNYA